MPAKDIYQDSVKKALVKDEKTIPITNIWDFLEFKGRIDLFDKVGKGAKRRKK